jgi:hypothetical protein
MKAKPVRRYRFPKYPTKLMILEKPDLLKKSMSTFKLPKKELAGALAVYLSVTSGCSMDWVSTACVAVVPPVYMSEEDALRIINEEFSGFGVTLSQDSADLDAVDLPIEEDAVDREHDIAVEFVSKADCVELGGGAEEDEFCDFHSVAQYLQEQVEAENPEVNFKALSDPQSYDEESAEELLRNHVREFAEWLKGQGVI